MVCHRLISMKLINWEEKLFQILYAKRNGLDDENIFCTNFTHSQQYSSRMLGQVEIGVYPFEYRVCNNFSTKKEKKTQSTCENTIELKDSVNNYH